VFIEVSPCFFEQSVRTLGLGAGEYDGHFDAGQHRKGLFDPHLGMCLLLAMPHLSLMRTGSTYDIEFNPLLHGTRA